MYQLYILDVDGTLVLTKKGGPYRHGAADWQWIPGRKEKIQTLITQGKAVGLATNQGGVAYGYLTITDIMKEILIVANELGIKDIGMVKIEPSHPKGTIIEYKRESARRKPGPGMLLELMHQTKITPQETLMIGDREDDRLAAHNAGCHFMWANEFFNAKKDDICKQKIS